ncbi:hypothetical protein TYRP_011683 [Tyrophagus putrescentiae]|nr:hypothetical protein TYRP_011683 [Tyrophagus putrescentiae]
MRNASSEGGFFEDCCTELGVFAGGSSASFEAGISRLSVTGVGQVFSGSSSSGCFLPGGAWLSLPGAGGGSSLLELTFAQGSVSESGSHRGGLRRLGTVREQQEGVRWERSSAADESGWERRPPPTGRRSGLGAMQQLKSRLETTPPSAEDVRLRL